MVCIYTYIFSIYTYLSPEKANGWNHTNWWCWVDLSFQEVAEVFKRHPAPTPSVSLMTRSIFWGMKWRWQILI